MMNHSKQKEATKQSQQDFIDRITEKIVFGKLTVEEIELLKKRNIIK